MRAFAFCRQECQDSVDAGLAALECGLGRKGVHEAGDLVAAVAEIDGLKFLAAFVQSEELEVGGGMIEPGHALGGRTAGIFRDDDFESAEMAAGIGSLAAVIEPEDAEGENAIDG